MGLPEKKTTHDKEQSPEKVRLYQEQINGVSLENMLVLMKQASIHTYFENMAMLQKVKKYTTKSVKKHKQIGIIAAKNM